MPNYKVLLTTPHHGPLVIEAEAYSAAAIDPGYMSARFYKGDTEVALIAGITAILLESSDDD